MEDDDDGDDDGRVIYIHVNDALYAKLKYL